MKRKTILALGLAFLFLAAAGFSPNAEPAEGLKLIVRLNPSNGVVPLAPAGSAIYTFEVSAMDELQRRIYVSDQAFVRDGQTRRVQRKAGRVEIKGLVRISEEGAPFYQAELLLDGRRAAATEASLEIRTPR